MKDHLRESFVKGHSWWYRMVRHIVYKLFRLAVEQAYLVQVACTWPATKREQESGKRCQRCLAHLAEAARFCSQCGESVVVTQPKIDTKELFAANYFRLKMRGENPMVAYREATRKTAALKQRITGELQ